MATYVEAGAASLPHRSRGHPGAAPLRSRPGARRGGGAGARTAPDRRLCRPRHPRGGEPLPRRSLPDGSDPLRGRRVWAKDPRPRSTATRPPRDASSGGPWAPCPVCSRPRAAGGARRRDRCRFSAATPHGQTAPSSATSWRSPWTTGSIRPRSGPPGTGLAGSPRRISCGSAGSRVPVGPPDIPGQARSGTTSCSAGSTIWFVWWGDGLPRDRGPPRGAGAAVPRASRAGVRRRAGGDGRRTIWGRPDECLEAGGPRLGPAAAQSGRRAARPGGP